MQLFDRNRHGPKIGLRPLFGEGQGLKCAGSHRVADPAHFDLPGLYRVSRSLVYSYIASVHL